ncbi:MAG: DUF4012 domain-containing protein, partial [Acidimicrobiales bacterium]
MKLSTRPRRLSRELDLGEPVIAGDGQVVMRRPPPPPRRRRLVWALPVAAVALLGSAWLAMVANHALRSRSDALAAVHDLEALRAGVNVTDPDFEQIQSRLDSSAAHLESARRRMRAGWMAPLRPLPVVGRQLSSFDHLASSGATIASSMSELTREGRELETRFDDGAASPIAALNELSAAAGRAAAEIEGADLGPSSGLAPQLANAHTRLSGERADLVDGLRRLSDAAAGVAVFLDDKRYLVLAGNPSEMRVGAGMILQVGTLATDGSAHPSLGGISSVGALQPGFAPSVDEHVTDNWRWLLPAVTWQNMAITPRFQIVAQEALAMWNSTAPDPAEGALFVDPLAMQALLRATGPVSVEGREITADNVLAFLGHGQYVELDAASAQRRELLAELTQTVLAAAKDRKITPLALVRALQPAVEGRHIRAFALDEAQQRGWRALGLEASAGPNDLVVSLSNHAANKMDWWLQVTADLALTRTKDGTIEGVLTVEAANTIPDGEPPYVSQTLNNDGSKDPRYGRYVGLVVMTLPGRAKGLRMDGYARPDRKPLPQQQQLALLTRAKVIVVDGLDGANRVMAAPFVTDQAKATPL